MQMLSNDEIKKGSSAGNQDPKKEVPPEPIVKS